MSQLTFEDVCQNRHGGNENSAAANRTVCKKQDLETVFGLVELAPNGLTLKEACTWMRRSPNQISGRFWPFCLCFQRFRALVDEGISVGCGERELRCVDHIRRGLFKDFKVLLFLIGKRFTVLLAGTDVTHRHAFAFRCRDAGQGKRSEIIVTAIIAGQ